MNFYIADMHFGHKNVIRYDNRPFDSIEEMDKAMITLWNETVGDNDVVYILGDFSWYKEEKTAFILGCLKGHKVLIRGNHDHISPKVARHFERICEYAEIKDGEEKVVSDHIDRNEDLFVATFSDYAMYGVRVEIRLADFEGAKLYQMMSDGEVVVSEIDSNGKCQYIKGVFDVLDEALNDVLGW